MITSYKLFLVLIICSAMFTCFYAVYKISQNRRTALLAVFLYIGSAYFETDLYSRAALGETQAFVFLPLVVAGFYEILWGDEKNISPLVIGFGGLLLSHLLTFFLAFLLGAFVCAIAVRRFFLEPKRFQSLFKAAVITVLLTAFFLFPLIEQMSAQLLRGKATHYGEYAQNRTMRLRNLFFMVSPPELYAPVAGVTFLGVLALRFFCGSPKTQAAKKRDLFYLMGIACLFACTSLFPWSFFEKLPGLDAIQFPWRFLLFATLFLAIGGAMAAEHFLEKISRPRWGAAVCVILIAALCILQFQTAFRDNFVRQEELHQTLYEVTDKPFVDSHYLPASAPQPWDGITVPEEAGLTREIFAEKGDLKVIFKAEQPGNKLVVPKYFYPGYEAVLQETGERLMCEKSADGFLQIVLNTTTEGTVKIHYRGTAIQFVSAGVSFLAAVALMGAYFRRRRKSVGEK